MGGEAVAAEEHGFDAVWIGEGGPEPSAVAAYLAGATTGLRVGLTATIGVEHPIELAEQMAVADLALNGRLVLAVRPQAGTEERVGEVLDLLLDCLASHPFRHAGPAWPAPANRDGNVFNLEQRIRVTPPPAQFELPLWVAGRGGRHDAVERGLGVVVDPAEPVEEVAAWWEATKVERPALHRRIRRAWRWSPPVADEAIDVAAAVDQLRSRQRAADVDLVIVDVAADQRGDIGALMADLMGRVRPRVQLDSYPPGLDEHWVENEQRETGAVHG